jgi:uncharacterized protein YycO
MKLVFSNSHLIGSWIIRKLTFSRWSHVAIVDGDTAIEAVWPRVRRVPLAHLLETHRDHEFAEIDVEMESVALSFAGSQIGKRYDLRALFGLITPTRDWERTEQWDCAELVAAAINAGSRKHLFRNEARVTPQMLYLLSKA